MSSWPYHKRYHSDALTGFRELNLEERGAYQTILDLMYDRSGPLIDDERILAGQMATSIRKWRSIRGSLISKGKIYLTEDGSISNYRVEKELENNAKTSRKRAENTSKTKRKMSEKSKNDNKISDGEEILHSYARAYPDTRYQSLEEEEKEEPPFTPLSKNGEPYAFCGRFVRLNRKDFDEREKIFHGIPDLRAELMAYDDWLSDQPEARQKKWFGGLGSWLSRRHQQAVERAGADDESVFTGPC